MSGMENEKERKPYTEPVVTDYGTVHELTKAVATRGSLDGSGVTGRDRTSA
jgi:hypothetical protein